MVAGSVWSSNGTTRKRKKKFIEILRQQAFIYDCSVINDEGKTIWPISKGVPQHKVHKLGSKKGPRNEVRNKKFLDRSHFSNEWNTDFDLG